MIFMHKETGELFLAEVLNLYDDNVASEISLIKGTTNLDALVDHIARSFIKEVFKAKPYLKTSMSEDFRNNFPFEYEFIGFL